MVAEFRTNTAGAVNNSWRATYASVLAFSDFLVLSVVVLSVQMIWFGFEAGDPQFQVREVERAASYTVLSVVIIAAWMLILSVYGTRGYRVIGTGSTEYRLVADGAVRLFGVVAIFAFLFGIDLAKGYILVAFPLGLFFLLLSRWAWRKWLGGKRANGEYSSTVLLVGSEASATHLAIELRRRTAAGYRVVGACLPAGKPGDYLPGTDIPVFGGVDDLSSALLESGADTVVITSSDLPPQRIRELSWSLEPGRKHLVVAPALTDIGGPRIHTRPVAGLPLIHVETPRYEGFKWLAKRLFDVVASAILIVIASPVLLIATVAVALGSSGPVLFRQERMGLGGKKFFMLKFRSMVVDAENLLPNLQVEERGEGNSVLFKMKNDPRITPVGRLMRRFSIDELPQLFNVLGGSMSLVGPRPPLDREVAFYEKHVHRRFLVKPGITGLWQVSGRSNLSWEDSVRLDLYYVENWSITGDLVILWRTARAVLAREGAY